MMGNSKSLEDVSKEQVLSATGEFNVGDQPVVDLKECHVPLLNDDVATDVIKAELISNLEKAKKIMAEYYGTDYWNVPEVVEIELTNWMVEKMQESLLKIGSHVPFFSAQEEPRFTVDMLLFLNQYDEAYDTYFGSCTSTIERTDKVLPSVVRELYGSADFAPIVQDCIGEDSYYAIAGRTAVFTYLVEFGLFQRRRLAAEEKDSGKFAFYNYLIKWQHIDENGMFCYPHPHIQPLK